MKAALFHRIAPTMMIALLSCGAALAAPAGNSVFEFSSGGAYHIEGFGEWRVRLDASGGLSIAHDVRGRTEDLGTFPLKDAESAAFWALVRALRLEQMESSKRSGMPDEARYTFVLRDGGRSSEVKLWVGDARKNERVLVLVDRIADLIEAHTKKKPVLK